jgi:hypothetical protein
MVFQHVAEQRIREAIDEGHFSNLAGAGKPLGRIDDELAGDDRMALHVLRSNGFLPEWLELRRQIYLERQAVAAALQAWTDIVRDLGSRTHPRAELAGDAYRRAATSINARIDLHNLRCPSIQLEIARFREDAQPSVG